MLPPSVASPTPGAGVVSPPDGEACHPLLAPWIAPKNADLTLAGMTFVAWNAR